MSWLIGALLLIVAVAGTLVALSRQPNRQMFAIAANGLVLSLLFFALAAPDVALSEIAVGTALTPLLFLATLTAIRINRERP